MITIELRQKTVCNTVRYYPSCENAKIFAQLVRRKTLHKSELNIIKKLGVTINITKES